MHRSLNADMTVRTYSIDAVYRQCPALWPRLRSRGSMIKTEGSISTKEQLTCGVKGRSNGTTVNLPWRKARSSNVSYSNVDVDFAVRLALHKQNGRVYYSAHSSRLDPALMPHHS